MCKLAVHPNELHPSRFPIAKFGIKDIEFLLCLVVENDVVLNEVPDNLVPPKSGMIELSSSYLRYVK